MYSHMSKIGYSGYFLGCNICARVIFLDHSLYSVLLPNSLDLLLDIACSIKDIFGSSFTLEIKFS